MRNWGYGVEMNGQNLDLMGSIDQGLTLILLGKY